MPVHAVSIANILNDMFYSFSYRENNEMVVRFTAPDARVLIVDDINTNLKVAEGLMLPYKIQIDLRKSGFDAIETINYDLVFMDHKMPGMDGIETTIRIRGMESEDNYFKTVPIIALTANAVAGTEEKFIENGFNDFISKPIDTVKLNTILAKWIPREKQKGATIETNRKPAQNEQTNQANFEIEGVDVNRGILLSGGSAEQYLDTLALFCKDAQEKIAEINNCLEARDLALYTIHVHALKSASANIGAIELSKAAFTLEKAGQRGDLLYIKNNCTPFLLTLDQLLNYIGSLLSSNESGADNFDKALFRKKLNTLKNALNDMDGDSINEAIESLLRSSYPNNIKSTIRKVSSHLLMTEYDEAEALIETLL
jgi:CheY-like chemotaxis protein